MKDAQINVADGRTIAYTDIGETSWPCVFFFHGAPMSRLHLGYLEQRFRAERIRVISPDRPGDGNSSPQRRRSLLDWSVDVAGLADALGIDRFIVAGHSSGGPYAVACAALLSARVSASIVLAGVTDMGWPGAWQGYIESEQQLMRFADEDSAVAWCVERFGGDGHAFLSATEFEFSEPDHALFADDRTNAALVSAIAEAFRQDVVGYAQDMIVQGRPWAFDPAGIVVPVHIVHGGLDTLVPLSHSRHTADVIHGSTLKVLPGHGHLSVVAELAGIAVGLVRSLCGELSERGRERHAI
jgi:pimeloyl-ACP methyl ester carboxylesterase